MNMSKCKKKGETMDRIFEKSSIEQICDDIKRILKESRDYMEDMISIANQAEDAFSEVPSYARDYQVTQAASSLKSHIRGVDLDPLISKLDDCRTRAGALIPTADSQFARETDALKDTINQIKEALSQIRDFLVSTPLTVDYNSFLINLEVAHANCEKILDDAGQAIDTILCNAKGAKEISTVFSKDPVNLSTGNFIYDRTDLEIQGSSPFIFRRFYNSVNNREGVLGKDWNHNYEIFLEGPEREKTLVLEDGKEERFILTSTGVYASLYQTDGVLEKTAGGYQYRTNSQDIYRFDEAGSYLCREDKNGNHVWLHYEEEYGKKRLVKIEKDTGEFFCLFYGEDGYLERVEDHTGREVRYEFTGGYLNTVVMPSGNSYCYSYTAEGKLESVQNPRGIVTVENTYDNQHRTTKQRFPDGTVMSYEYDDENRRLTMTERNGSKSVHIHDEKYRNVKNIYPDGEETFEYNANNQKTKITDKLGNVTRMTYDNRGNLTGVINPLGTKLSLTYEVHNQPLSVSVNGKQKVKNQFDRCGNLLETTDALGRKTSFSYNEKGLPACVIQPDESRILLSYDKKGNISKLIDAKGGTTQYAYDKLNRVTESIDPKGNHTRYSYDNAGNLHMVTNADGAVRTYEYNQSGKVTKITDFDGSSIQRVYNVLNKPEKIIDQLGRETRLQYDTMWNLARVTEPNGAKTTFFYNKNNQLARIKDPNGNVKRYTYDGNGNRLSEMDENGSVTRFTYDALGQLIHVEGPEGMEYTYSYDEVGNVTEVTDALGGKVRMEYDAAGQLIRESNPLGESRHYTYTALGNVANVMDEAGKVTQYEYLPGGQVQNVIHPDGTKECYTYDINGNVTTYTNVSGFTLSYIYDRLDRIIRIEGSDGERKEYDYDAVGNVTAMTDASGNRTRYEYSLTGQLMKVIDPLGNETEYSYDDCDRLIEIRQYGEDGSLKDGADTSGMDAELLEAERRNKRNRICHVTKYRRNLTGQVETITDALGLQEHYSYDPKGQLTEKLDKEGYLTRYGYTGQGDVNRIQYADGREVEYSYNPLRHLQEMSDWLGVTKIDTDPLGRATGVQYPDGKTVSYTYGKAGERTSITYPDGRTVYYGFDEQVRLSKLKAGDSVITYGYDEAGRLAEKHFPNGVHTNYRYDSKDQIKELIHKDRAGILDRYLYQYDLLGNKTGIEKQRRGLAEESGSYCYGYDALGRLMEVAKDGNPLRRYTYDAFGNRTGLTGQGKTTTYVYNTMNQLLTRVNADMEETYTYDKRGNLSQICANGQVKNQYLYGALNRLEQAVNGKGEAAKYQYNGLGHRVGKIIGQKSFHTTCEGLNPVKQLQDQIISPEKLIQYTIDLTRGYHNLLQKEEDNYAQTFLWDGNVAGMLDDRSRTNGQVDQQYYFQDELGSPIRLMDENGNLADSYGYDEFGQDLYGNQGKVQPFGYTGYQKDNVASSYFAHAREYTENIGRFVNQDPIRGEIRNAQTQNQYKYCLNSPFRYIDPTGRCEEIESAEDLQYIIQNGLLDNFYGFVVDGLNITSASLGTMLKKGIIEEIRPNNIGKGTWKKWVSSQLDDVAKLFGSSADDVVRGFANVKVTGLFPKVLDKLGYVGAAIDAITGVKDNIKGGATWQKTTSDAVVDVAVSGATIWAAGTAGMAIGTAAGTVVPGAGNVVGAIGGFIVGVVGYVATDVIKINGKSIRDNIKDGISDFFGWK